MRLCQCLLCVLGILETNAVCFGDMSDLKVILCLGLII